MAVPDREVVMLTASEEDEHSVSGWPVLADVIGRDDSHGLIRVRVNAPEWRSVPADLGMELLRVIRERLERGA